MTARVLLVLGVVAVLYGCSQANSPVITLEEPTTPGAAPLMPEHTTPVSGAPEGASASAGISGEEQAAQSEADCRIATYVAEKNMSRQEANAFAELLADMIRTMADPSWTAGSLRNAALDHLAVPRYPECKARGA
jgi:hypothetical protein